MRSTGTAALPPAVSCSGSPTSGSSPKNQPRCPASGSSPKKCRPPTFGRAVAHEIGHAWLAQYGHIPVAHEVEEGLCELFAYAWLKRERSPLADTLRSQLRADPDPVYGGGFRTVHAAVDRHGIENVLTSLLTNGALP